MRCKKGGSIDIGLYWDFHVETEYCFPYQVLLVKNDNHVSLRKR